MPDPEKTDDLTDEQITDTKTDDVEDGLQKDDQTIVEDENKQDLKDVDPDDLSDEDIENLDLSQFEELVGDDFTTETIDKAEEKLDGEKKDENISPDPPSEGGKEKDDTDSDKDVTHDPLKDTKSALTKEQMRRAEIEKDLEKAYDETKKLKKQLRESTVGEFSELSAEQLEEIKWDDPDAYRDYFLNKREYEARQKDVNDAEQREQDAEIAQRDQGRLKSQADEILDFLKLRGVSADDEKAVTDFTSSDNFKKLDKFVTEKLKPNEDGVYSVDQMKIAWDVLNFEDIKSDIQAKTTAKTFEKNIEKAKNGGSPLDKMPRGATTKPKPVSNMTLDEINDMDEKSVDQALAELEKAEG